jgi:hypothetical protein
MVLKLCGKHIAIKNFEQHTFMYKIKSFITNDKIYDLHYLIQSKEFKNAKSKKNKLFEHIEEIFYRILLNDEEISLKILVSQFLPKDDGESNYFPMFIDYCSNTKEKIRLLEFPYSLVVEKLNHIGFFDKEDSSDYLMNISEEQIKSCIEKKMNQINKNLCRYETLNDWLYADSFMFKMIELINKKTPINLIFNVCYRNINQLINDFFHELLNLQKYMVRSDKRSQMHMLTMHNLLYDIRFAMYFSNSKHSFFSNIPNNDRSYQIDPIDNRWTQKISAMKYSISSHFILFKNIFKTTPSNQYIKSYFADDMIDIFLLICIYKDDYLQLSKYVEKYNERFFNIMKKLHNDVIMVIINRIFDCSHDSISVSDFNYRCLMLLSKY